MTMAYFAEMHKLVERAKTLERVGKDSEALEIYLEVHEKFFPNTSDLYERPAVLLEKKKRFKEAIAMCEKAIKYIDEGKITGVRDNFSRRIDRIKSRSDYEVVSVDVKKKKKSEPIDWSFLTNIKIKWALIGSFLSIVVIAGVVFYLAVFFKPSFELDFSKIDFSALRKAGMIETQEENEAYKKAYEALQEKEQEKPDPMPVITEEMIKHAIKVAERVFQVERANVVAKDDVAGFALIVSPQMSKDDAQKAADTFVKALAAAAANEYDYLEGPNPSNYGELYKHYSIMIAIGIDGTENELFLMGSKKKSVDKIFFRKPLKDFGL